MGRKKLAIEDTANYKYAMDLKHLLLFRVDGMTKPELADFLHKGVGTIAPVLSILRDHLADQQGTQLVVDRFKVGKKTEHRYRLIDADRLMDEEHTMWFTNNKHRLITQVGTLQKMIKPGVELTTPDSDDGKVLRFAQLQLRHVHETLAMMV